MIRARSRKSMESNCQRRRSSWVDEAREGREEVKEVPANPELRRSKKTALPALVVGKPVPVEDFLESLVVDNWNLDPPSSFVSDVVAVIGRNKSDSIRWDHFKVARQFSGTAACNYCKKIIRFISSS